MENSQGLSSPTVLRIIILASEKNISLSELEKKVGIARKNLLVHIKNLENKGLVKRKQFEHSRAVYLEVSPNIKEKIGEEMISYYNMPEKQKVELVASLSLLKSLGKDSSLGEFERGADFSKDRKDFIADLFIMEMLGLVTTEIKITKYGMRLLRKYAEKINENLNHQIKKIKKSEEEGNK